MALLILALLQRIFLMSSLMVLLVLLIFLMVLIKLLPILGTISGKTVKLMGLALIFFFSSRRRHPRFDCDWSSDVCSSDLPVVQDAPPEDLVHSVVPADVLPQ